VLSGQGVSRRRRHHPGPVPQPPPEEVETPSQHQPRQDPMHRRAGHGHPQGWRPLRKLRCSTPTGSPTS
jgi:hypothetical protein